MQPLDFSSCSKSWCPVFIYLCSHLSMFERHLIYAHPESFSYGQLQSAQKILDTPVIHKHFQCLWQGPSNYHCSFCGLPALYVQGLTIKGLRFILTISFLIAQDSGIKKRKRNLGRTNLVPFVYLSSSRTSLPLELADGTCWYREHLLLQIWLACTKRYALSFWLQFWHNLDFPPSLLWLLT